MVELDRKCFHWLWRETNSPHCPCWNLLTMDKQVGLWPITTDIFTTSVQEVCLIKALNSSEMKTIERICFLILAARTSRLGVVFVFITYLQ